LTGPGLRPVELLDGKHELAHFDCGLEALDQWLRKSAGTAAAAGTAATYVLCRDRRVVGYYALAMGSVEHGRAPSRLRRGMPDPVPVVVLARLALDRAEHGRLLGGELLVDALRRSVRGGREFGAGRSSSTPQTTTTLLRSIATSTSTTSMRVARDGGSPTSSGAFALTGDQRVTYDLGHGRSVQGPRRPDPAEPAGRAPPG
jgi:hypothetical protein